MKKITWYKKPAQTLFQAYGSGVEFAFCSSKNEQTSPFAYCKDYLQDSILAFVSNKSRTIYGFTYDPKVHEPLCLIKTLLLVTNSSDPKLAEKIPACLEFVNLFEKRLKMRRLSTVQQCANPPEQYAKCGVWYFEGSRRWMKSPPMISLYALLIRIGFSHKLGTSLEDSIAAVKAGKYSLAQTSDQHRFIEAWAGIERILKQSDQKIFNKKIKDNYPTKIDVSSMHGCGILSFATKSPKSWCKEYANWYANEDAAV